MMEQRRSRHGRIVTFAHDEMKASSGLSKLTQNVYKNIYNSEIHLEMVNRMESDREIQELSEEEGKDGSSNPYQKTRYNH